MLSQGDQRKKEAPSFDPPSSAGTAKINRGSRNLVHSHRDKLSSDSVAAKQQ